MKYIFIFILLLTVSTIASASTDPAEISNAEIESPIDMPESNVIVIIIKGDLSFWINQQSQVSIECDPPFLPICYTITWVSTYPTDKTIILNDGQETEINVSSEAVITTDESGTETHTFTK